MSTWYGPETSVPPVVFTPTVMLATSSVPNTEVRLTEYS